MATVTLTDQYNDLEDWPGRLLEADESTTIAVMTATQFVFVHGAGSDFQGYSVVVTGTGFEFLDGIAVEGVISSVQILNEADEVVMTISGLETGTELANDFSQMFANVVGSPDPNSGPGPDGYIAWQHLLSGNDTFTGTPNDNWEQIVGLNAGNDTFAMGDGDDYMSGGKGRDRYDGGAGWDMLSFRETTYNLGGTVKGGVTINVQRGTVTDAWGDRDRIISVESFEGSRFSDKFTGHNSRDDSFAGLRGRDVIDGGANSFRGTRQSSDDQDRVDYGSDYWEGGNFGIVVDLETSFVGGSIRGTIRDGFGHRDTVIDIEKVVGTRFDDTFVGSRVGNLFEGGEGVDFYDGQGGEDTLWLRRWFGDDEVGGVVVDLSLETGQIINDGFGNTETAINIEHVVGTDNADEISGNASYNDIQAGRGNDVLEGGGGNDVFRWTGFDEVIDSDTILDFAATGEDADQLHFDSSGFEGMTDTLVFLNGDAPTQAVGTFYFDTNSDGLYWDADGTGSDSAELVAFLPGVVALSEDNFFIY